ATGGGCPGNAGMPRFPVFPPMAGGGWGESVSASFTGLVVPAGTPTGIVSLLNEAVNRGLNSAEMIAAFDRLGVEMKPGSAEDFAAFIARENARWTTVAKAANVRID